MDSGTSAVRSAGQIRVAHLVCGALLLMVIANLGRIPVLSTGERDVPILVNDLVLAALIGAGFVSMAAHRSFVVDRVIGYALTFAAIGAVSAVLAVPRFGLSAFAVAISLGYLARWLFYFSIYVVVINTVRARDVDQVWAALETAILVFAAFGIVQSAFLPDFALMVYPEARKYMDWDPQGHRLVSTVLDPNFAGAFIVIGLLVSLARLSTGARVPGWRLLLLTVALVLTASRSAVLAFVAGGFTILVIRGISPRMLRAGAAGLVLLGLASPKLIEFGRAYKKFEINASALERVTQWSHGVQVLSDHPVIGIGFNTWGFVQELYGWPRLFAATYGLDGGLLFIAVMTGFVGVTAYLVMLGAVWRRASRVWRNAALPASHRGIAVGAAAIIPAMIVHAVFINSLMFPILMETMWVLWALVVCADSSVAADAGPMRAPRVTARIVSLADA